MAKEIEQEIAELLIRNHMTVTTAESCTGGLVAGRLINAAGISAAYRQGYITYANEAKHKLLGVKNKTLRKHGAVSRQTAKQMAKGAAAAAKADAAISVTGIAGPDGGTKEKPVGLVYIGCYVQGKVTVKECHFSGISFGNSIIDDLITKIGCNKTLYVRGGSLDKRLILILTDQTFADLVDFIVRLVIVQSCVLPL